MTENQTPQDGDKETPEEHAKKPHLSIEDLLLSNTADGMSLERYEQIAEAKKNGNAIDVSPEEEAEYEEVSASLKTSMESLRKAVTASYAPVFKNLAEARAKLVKPPVFSAQQSFNKKTEDILRPFTNFKPVETPRFDRYPSPDMTEVFENRRKKVEADELIAKEQLKATSETAELLRRQVEAAAQAEAHQDEMNRHQKRMNWSILIATGVGVGIAIVALGQTLGLI